MKKQALALVTGLATLLIGLAAAISYAVRTPEEVQAVSVQIESASACGEGTSFPGLSISRSGARKFKNGFFPTGIFGGGDADKTYNNVWYGKHLRAMGESSMLDEPDEEAYRFLWLRTFHHPVAVRIERTGPTLASVELTGAGGYEPGKVLRKNYLRISSEDWCEFLTLLEKARFWSMATVSKDGMGNDGSQWILEGVRDGRYHVVDRWTPMEGDYREACLFLLKLSGRDLKELGDDLY